EGDVALDQATGQQAALTEEVAPIGIADASRFLIEIESRPCRRPHQPDSAIVSSQMALRRDAWMPGDELTLHFLKQPNPCINVLARDIARGRQVLHPQILLIGVGLIGIEAAIPLVADQERRILRPEEARTVSRLIELAERSNADEVRQRIVVPAQ